MHFEKVSSGRYLSTWESPNMHPTPSLRNFLSVAIERILTLKKVQRRLQPNGPISIKPMMCCKRSPRQSPLPMMHCMTDPNEVFSPSSLPHTACYKNGSMVISMAAQGRPNSNFVTTSGCRTPRVPIFCPRTRMSAERPGKKVASGEEKKEIRELNTRLLHACICRLCCNEASAGHLNISFFNLLRAVVFFASTFLCYSIHCITLSLSVILLASTFHCL